jgi:exodeoxyribonuclease VII large subunit
MDAAYRMATMSATGRFDGLAARLTPRPLHQRADQAETNLADLSRRLDRAFGQGVETGAVRLATAGQLLETLSHKGVLGRGYAYVTGADGRPVTRAAEVEPGSPVEIHWQDGGRGATVDGGPAKRPAKGAAAVEGRQRTLF